MNIVGMKNVLFVDAHKAVTEASDLQLHGWPKTLPVEKDFGNGQALRLVSFDRYEGEITGARYVQDLGIISLLVIND